MFQYTKDVVLNSLESEAGVANGKVKIVDNKLVIERVGEYEIEKIVEKKLIKTLGQKGVKSVMEIECTDLIKSKTDGTSTIYETGLYQLSLYVKTPNQYFPEYAYPNWYYFGKPILVGFTVDAATAQSGTELAKLLKDRIELAVPANNKFVSAVIEGTTLKLTLNDPYVHFGEIIFEYYDQTACDSCLGEYNERDIKANITVTDGKEPFATGAWLQENLRFPSYPNIRYAAVDEENYPVPGVVYNQYTFEYRSSRPGYGGLMGVGMPVEALTRHIIYLPADLSSDFEAALTGLTVTPA